MRGDGFGVLWLCILWLGTGGVYSVIASLISHNRIVPVSDYQNVCRHGSLKTVWLISQSSL